jgi:hypothetical protein
MGWGGEFFRRNPLIDRMIEHLGARAIATTSNTRAKQE